jgi:hypothetical protein
VKIVRAPWLCVILSLLSGCPNKDEHPVELLRDSKLGAQRCSGQPGPRAKVQPVFQRPFEQQFPVLNMFDHDLPLRLFGTEQKTDQELTYCGIQALGLIDGYRGYSFLTPIGTPILAPAAGEVSEAGFDAPFACPITMRVTDSQLSVTLLFDTLGGVGYFTTFSHLSKILVKPGEKVLAGQRIGLSGDSGCSTLPLTSLVVSRLTSTNSGQPAVVDPYGWDKNKDDPWAKHPQGAESVYLWKTGEAPTLRTH